MEDTPRKKSLLKSFPSTYWVVIVMEFFERSAYYGMFAMLAPYFVAHVGNEEQFGAMKTVLTVILYIVPLFSGALAEKMGYKRVLGIAFVLMTVAYLGVGSVTSFPIFLVFMVMLGLGGGLFKPVISGTVARSTDESNSTLGFGIYYWSINVGSFIASLVVAHFLRLDKSDPTGNHLYPVFVLAAVYVGLMFFNNLIFYKEPEKPGKIKTFSHALEGMVTVFLNWRFILLLLIFSGFWGLYFRSNDSVLWLLDKNYIDFTPVNQFVTNIASAMGFDYKFIFNEAHVMTINAGVIILLQVVVSYLVRNTKPLPTMITGIAIATLFPIMVAISTNPWVFIFGLILFSIGEITAYPKLISYVGLIAPKDKVAIYMGFVFLPICFGSLFFDYPNGVIWNKLVNEGNRIPFYWSIVAGLGVITIMGLLAYHLFVGKKLSIEGSGAEDVSSKEPDAED